MKQTNTPTERAAGVWKALATLRKRLDKYAVQFRQDLTTTDMEQAEKLTEEVEEISRAVMELQEGVERLYDEANRAADEALYFDMGKNSGKGVSLNITNNFPKQPTPQDLGDKNNL